MTDDDESPVVAAMAVMAEHGITLDAARADAQAVHHSSRQFDTHHELPVASVVLTDAQREQVDKTSVELVRSLSPDLRELLTQVRSGDVSAEDFEVEYRTAYKPTTS